MKNGVHKDLLLVFFTENFFRSKNSTIVNQSQIMMGKFFLQERSSDTGLKIFRTKPPWKIHITVFFDTVCKYLLFVSILLSVFLCETSPYSTPS